MTDPHLSSDESRRAVNHIIKYHIQGLNVQEIHYELLQSHDLDVPLPAISSALDSNPGLIDYRRRKSALARTLSTDDMVLNLNETLLSARSLMDRIETTDIDDPAAQRNLIGLMATIKGLVDSGLKQINVSQASSDLPSDSIRICELADYVSSNRDYFVGLLGSAEPAKKLPTKKLPAKKHKRKSSS